MYLEPGRVRDMVDHCRSVGGHIPCHEFLDRPGGQWVAGPMARGAICRGCYDTVGLSPLHRLAIAVSDGIVWVEPPPAD